MLDLNLEFLTFWKCIMMRNFANYSELQENQASEAYWDIMCGRRWAAANIVIAIQMPHTAMETQ